MAILANKFLLNHNLILGSENAMTRQYRILQQLGTIISLIHLEEGNNILAIIDGCKSCILDSGEDLIWERLES